MQIASSSERIITTIVRSDLSGYVSIAAPVLDWNGDLRFTLSLAGTRASMKTEPTSEQVKALLDSASRATQAIGGKADRRDDLSSATRGK